MLVVLFMAFLFIFMTKLKRDIKLEHMNNEMNKDFIIQVSDIRDNLEHSDIQRCKSHKPMRMTPQEKWLKTDYDSSYNAGMVFI